jgi:peroxiredoxin 2/4
MALVAKPAPDFTAKAVMPNNEINKSFNLYKYLNTNSNNASIGVLFFYPLDFTFVCPSEIIAFNHRLGDFSTRNAKVIAVSVDSEFSHLAWKNTPVNKGGIGNVQFPMVADITKSISRNYGVLFEDSVSLRGTFLIDQNGIIRHQLINDLPLGRNVDEALRMVDSLLFYQKSGEVCPAGWRQGEEAIEATPEGIAAYLTSNADKL